MKYGCVYIVVTNRSEVAYFHQLHVVRLALVETAPVVMENVSFVAIQVELTQGGPTNRDISLNFVTSDINTTGTTFL